MKYFYTGLLLLGLGCIPSMHTGPDPHSIIFEKNQFDEIRFYLNTNVEQDYVIVDQPPATLDKNIIDKMEKLGFLEYRRYDQKYEIFKCGCGVIDQGCWGFIYGKLLDNQTLISIESGTKVLKISYLEYLEGNWYRYAGEINNSLSLPNTH